MRPIVFGRALAALFLVALAVPAVAQTGFPWWKDPKVVQELMLSADQSTRVDNVFQAVFPQLRQSKEELDLRQVDKVEGVRGSLNKARTLMLLHMRQVLTPKQNKRFNAVFEQYRRDNPRPVGTPPPDASRPSDVKGRTQNR
jgi:hypothetical protein